MSLFGDVTRGLADVMTFGGNEVMGNPVGKFADQIVNPSDPNAYQKDLAQQNLAYQKEFAQNGIQWRVKDAVAAGLSPLVGAGVSEPSFNPVGVQLFGDDVRSTGLNMLSNMGQDLFRSRLASSSVGDRMLETSRLRLSNAQADLAETQVKAAKLRLAQMSMPPPNPAVPSFQSMVDPDGNTYLMPSNEFSQASHGTMGSQWSWMLRNSLLPSSEQLKTNLWDNQKYGWMLNPYQSN